eukprot:3896117-Rhodomonas_salina.1
MEHVQSACQTPTSLHMVPKHALHALPTPNPNNNLMPCQIANATWATLAPTAVHHAPFVQQTLTKTPWALLLVRHVLPTSNPQQALTVLKTVNATSDTMGPLAVRNAQNVIKINFAQAMECHTLAESVNMALTCKTPVPPPLTPFAYSIHQLETVLMPCHQQIVRDEFYCVLFVSRTVKCFGKTWNGRLGNGFDPSLSWYKYIGDSTNELYYTDPIDFGTGETVAKLVTGQDFACVLLDSAKVKCWGYNNVGQLGIGSTSLKGTSASHMGDNLLAVNTGDEYGVVDIDVSTDHACAILSNGALTCWGANTYGKLGIGKTNTNWGSSPSHEMPQWVDLGTGVYAKKVTTGRLNTCVLTTLGKVKCWGYGRILGYGDTVSRGSNPIDMGDNLPFVDLGDDIHTNGGISDIVQITDGALCVHLVSKRCKCFGEDHKHTFLNANQKEGFTIGDDPSETGNNLPLAFGGSQIQKLFPIPTKQSDNGGTESRQIATNWITPPFNYADGKAGGMECTACSRCNDGLYESERCTTNKDTTCSACSTTCPYPQSQMRTQNCTKLADIVCETICKQNEFRNTTQNTCETCSNCSNTERMITPCTIQADTTGKIASNAFPGFNVSMERQSHAFHKQ